MPNQAVLLGSLTLPGEPACPHEAREFVARTLASGNADADTAALLTSELVTNSVQHSNSSHPGGTITITVVAVTGRVRVEVVDDGGATVPAVAASQPGQAGIGESGRGLRLVDVLSARWSYYRDSAGTVTWFELTDDPHE